jgi:general secretion pathway protein K
MIPQAINDDRQQGIALVLVLWGVTLIAVLAAAFAQSAGIEARRLGNVVAAAEAHSRLDEGLAAAVVGLSDADRARRWRTDGTPYRWNAGDAAIEVAVFAETGRIDINRAPPAVLFNLARQAAGPAGEAVAAAILAQSGRSPDGKPLADALQGGARPFLSVVELAALPGMTAAAYRRLAGAVTVHNPGGRLDWRTADATALAALPGMTAETAARLVAARRVAEQRQSLYTPDPDLAKILADGGADSDISQGDNSVYTMRVTVRTSRRAVATAEAVVRLTSQGAADPYRILEWREPAAEEAER